MAVFYLMVNVKADYVKMTREEYNKRCKEAVDRHTADQYGYYGEMMDIDYDYIAALETRIAELDNELSALRTKWDELPAFLVKQDEADIFDEHNLNMLLIEYILDIKPEEK